VPRLLAGVLTKDLLRVSRAGGGYHPQFTGGEGDEALAGRVLGVFQGHVGEERGALRDALRDLEGEADDFKLVRGFAHLVERDAGFEVRAPVDPERARRAAFDAAEDVAGGVVHGGERERALAEAAARFPGDVSSGDLADALYADRETREVLVEVPDRWTPPALVAQYNLSLAQTALFDATEVRVRSSDPRRLVSAVKRLGLLYEVVPVDDGREVVLTGPDAVLRHTRRYGTRFARVLRSVAETDDWRLEAAVDDRGTERRLVLTDDDLAAPDADPVTEVSFDSGVEREFAQRFDGLDLDWELVREPDVLAAGERLMVPDFAFEYAHGDARVYFEIMGFWTPEYVEKKLDQLAETDETLLVAVDRSLGVGEEVAARDHRVVEYAGSVRVKDVVNALRDLEADLVADQADDLPAALVPEDDVVSLADLAAGHGVSEQAIEGVDFPEHERVGRTLVRPSVLDAIDADLEPGLSKDDAEAVVADHGVDDASAVFSRLGYRVEWEGLGSGTLREK